MYLENPYYMVRTAPNDNRSPLLPFLAGVLVTTPFIFLNKQNQQPYPVYPVYPPYQQYPQYQPYSMPYPNYQPYPNNFNQNMWRK